MLWLLWWLCCGGCGAVRIAWCASVLDFGHTYSYSIRGAFWLQGEHNLVTHSSRELYACEFGGMINAWRDAWTGPYGSLAPNQ